MMKKYILPLIAAIVSLSATAQELKYCGADEMAHDLYHSHPELQQSILANRAALKAFTKDYEAAQDARGGSADTVYVIPVVFHIIHTYGPENISDEQIMSGLKVMNWNFRNQNPDTATIAPAFKPIVADCGIEFRLAHLDPNGNCTSGINRIASPLTNGGQHNVKDLIHWDPSKYLNIYVVKSIPNLAGHCLMPDQAAAKPEWDGIVIDDSYVGDIGTSSDLTSVVLAHEAGHYLNLFHIWGGNNVPGYYYLPVGQQANCGEGDEVADTPPTIGWSNCNLNAASCGNVVDNVQNAMDYSYCNFMFTQGQRSRMRAALNSPIANRNNLSTFNNIDATGINLSVLCQVYPTSDRQTACIGDTIKFIDKSLPTPDSWLWDFGDGILSTQQNPVHAYAASGEYNVMLKVTKDSYSLTKYIYDIRINGSGNPFFVQNFESISSLDNSHLINQRDNENLKFIIYIGVGYNSMVSTGMAIPDTTHVYGGKNTFISPAINMANIATAPFLKFNYAFAQRVLNNNDRMEVFFSKDCGKSWQSQNNRVGANLRTITETQTDTWQPADSTEWRKVSLALPTAYRVEGFMFKIEFTNFKGNAMYLDNININPEAYVGIKEATLQSVELLPNPADKYIMLNGLLNEQPFQIMDIHGRVCQQGKTANGEKIDVSNLTTGMYVMRVAGNAARFFKCWGN